MRILLLNLYFPPDTSATAKVAEAMVQTLAQTHEVTVLCGRPSYDPTERRPWRLWQRERVFTKNFASRESLQQNPATFTVIRVGSTDYPRMQMKLRLLNYLTYTKIAFWRGLFIPCDVIFAMTDPPFAGILAAYLATWKRKPLIYDIQDLYPDMAVAGSIVEPGALVRIWEKLHRWALRRAARIIVLGEDMRARIIAKDIDPSKIFIIRNALDTPTTTLPNSPDAKSFDSSPSTSAMSRAASTAPPFNPEVIRAIRANFRFVLLHAGNLGFYGAWNTLIVAARQLENENIGLVFVGDGAERARLESLAAGAKNIRFLAFFPSCEIPSVLEAPDIHIVTVKRGLEGVVVPSKMFGILAAAKPILAVAPPETDIATLGILHGFAVSADPGDPTALAALLRDLAEDPEKLAAMSKSAAHAATHYSRAGELAKLNQLFVCPLT
jgi:colanic acid biosynthesis glycosyl transferase WcaI